MVIIYHNRTWCGGRQKTFQCNGLNKFCLPECFSDHTSEAMNNVSSTTASPVKNERNTPEPEWPA